MVLLSLSGERHEANPRAIRRRPDLRAAQGQDNAEPRASFGEIGRFVGRPADLAEESPLGGTADLALRELVEIVKQHQARLSSVRRLRPPQAVKPKHPVKVTITYCAACGYEPQTLELVKALMLGPRFDLSSIEIVVGEEGAFEVTVGSELVHSMYRDGGFPESEKVIEAVKEAVER